MATRPSAEFGRQGETLAREFLETLGYHFIERNWHCRSGEIDLVMRDGDEIVFVEVKARHGERSGRAGEAVSRTKARKLLVTGEWYIATHPAFQELFWRCDLIAITFHPGRRPDIAHYVNALVVG